MKTFGKFVVYEVKVGNEVESICMDFKNKYNNGRQNGLIYLKNKMDKEGPYKPVDCKPDLIVKMSLQTFNKLAEKKLGGAFAFLT